MIRTTLVLIGAMFLLTSSAHALSVIYSLNMTGAQEVAAPGDPDGLATGTLTVDDSTNLISWNFVYSNISAPIAMHIHGPGGSAGSNAGVFVGLGVVTTGGAGTLINSVSTTAGNIAAIIANPSDFYVNIHTGDFTGGAVRGQLGNVVPEPTTALLVGLGLAGLAGQRRLRNR